MYFIDTRYGVAGDMISSSFIDLDFIEREKIAEILERAGNVMGETRIEIKKIKIEDFNATQLTVSHKSFEHVRGIEMQNYLDKACESIGLSKGEKMAKDILNTLLKAEATVHGDTIDEIHLHETGCPDTLVDIVGIAYFYEELKLYNERIYGTPISVGSGFVEIEHGIVPVPAPATNEILKSMKYDYGPFEGEMATPTGVAIMKNLLQSQMDVVPFVPKKIGYGAGTKKFGDVIGFVRLLRC